MPRKHSIPASLLRGLVAAMDKARRDRTNATWGHVCQVCGPEVWHRDGRVCVGICEKHWTEIKSVAEK